LNHLQIVPIKKTSIAETESFSFFKDTDEDWELVREGLFQQRHVEMSMENNNLIDTNNGAKYFQVHWEPEIHCRHSRRLGPSGDGGKWVCDPHRIERNNCLLYSVGSSNDWSFETAVYEHLGCEIHTFDHTMSVIIGQPNFVNFHKIGLGEFPGDSEPPRNGSVTSLTNLIDMLGHSNRTIDILKIDCEGCEFGALTDLFLSDIKVNVRQLLIEIHAHTHDEVVKSHELITAIVSDGFVPFAKEPNIQYSGGNCIEYGFIRLAIQIEKFEAYHQDNK